MLGPMWIVLYLCTWTMLMSSSVAEAKLCCDQDCTRPISYGRTTDRYITQEIGHLSFPNSAIVTVLAKQETVDSLDREMWLAEIQSRKGLIVADFVSELHILCEPKPIAEESFDDVTPEYHTEAEVDETQSVSPGVQSDLPPIQSENTPFQSTDSPPHLSEHQDVEYVNEHEQGTEYTADQDHGGSFDGHLEDAHAQHTLPHEPEIHVHSHEGTQPDATSSETDQQSQSEQAQQHDSHSHEDMMQQHQQNVQQDNHEHGVPGQEVPPGVAHGDNAHSSNDDFSDGSPTVDKESDDVLVGGNHQWPDESLDLMSYNESNPVTTNQDDVESGFPSDPERATENSGGSEPTAMPGHFESAENPLPSAQPTYTDESSTDVGMDYEEQPALSSQESVDRSRHAKDMTGPPQITLRSGENAHVEQLPDGIYRITTDSGSTMEVDYDYIYDLDVDILNALDYYYTATVYDRDNGVEQSNGEVPTVKTESHERESATDEGYSSDESHDERSQEDNIDGPMQPEQNVHHHTSSVPSVEDRHKQHHSYLDVQSLRKRYQHDRTSDSNKKLNPDRTQVPPDNQDITTEHVHTQPQTEYTHLPTPEPEEWTEHTEPPLHTLEPEEPTQQVESHLPVQEPEELTQHAEMHLPPPEAEQPSQHGETHLPTLEHEHLTQYMETHLPTPAEPEQQTLHTETHLPTLETKMRQVDDDIPTPETEPVTQRVDSHHSEPDIDCHGPPDLNQPPKCYGELPVTIENEKFRTVPSSHMWSVDLITKYLPPSIASWVLEQGPELGFIGLAASILTLVIPLCCSCCHYWKDSRRKATTISKQSASRKALEGQIQKFKSEKNSVHTKLLLLEERYGSLENELEEVQEKNHDLAEAKADLEETYARVCSNLTSVQQELMQCNGQLDQLHSDLKHEQMQLSAQINEKEVALQQIALLEGQIQECQQNVQELEATKEQLEEDAFSTHNSLQKLESLHSQVSQELTDALSETAHLKLLLESSQAQVSSLQQVKTENEQEIQTLNSCLSQLTISADKNSGAGDAQGGEEGDGTDAEMKIKEETLRKIQAMLDTTKAQTELQEAVKERDENIAALEEQTALVKQLQVENTRFQDNTRSLETQLSDCSTRLKKLQEKHATLTEYFEQKEHNLHRMLGAEEAVRQAVETREAQVKEKAESLEQTEARHKEELKQLRTEMFEIEKSLMSQVHTCQKRAEEAIAEQRRLEQECKALKLDREDMRKRLTAKSVSPSAGSSTDRQTSLIVRPPSAPYLPRTSSPGAFDSPDNEQIASVLNNTDPLPGSHTRPPVAFPNHSHHLPHDQSFPSFQPPLRHPIPERERVRYPPPAPPPPGRRIFRGYVPFDRRHPIPPPRGHYGPVHRFHHETSAIPERRRPVSNPPPGARSTPPLGMYPPHPSPSTLPNSSVGFVPVEPAVPASSIPSSNVPNPHPQEINQIGKYPEV